MRTLQSIQGCRLSHNYQNILVITKTYSRFSDFSSMSLITWSNCAAKMLSEVKMAPFGPNLYSFITALYLTLSLMSMFAGNFTFKTAGSRLIL